MECFKRIYKVLLKYNSDFEKWNKLIRYVSKKNTYIYLNK